MILFTNEKLIIHSKCILEISPNELDSNPLTPTLGLPLKFLPLIRCILILSRIILKQSDRKIYSGSPQRIWQSCWYRANCAAGAEKRQIMTERNRGSAAQWRLHLSSLFKYFYFTFMNNGGKLLRIHFINSMQIYLPVHCPRENCYAKTEVQNVHVYWLWRASS